MTKLKVFIADRHPLMVKGIISFLSQYPDIYSKPEGFTDISMAIEACKTQQADILILGEFSVNVLGADFVRWVSKENINANIIVYVENMPFIDTTALTDAGARGCVWKNSHPTILNRAIDFVSHGYTYFDSAFVKYKKTIERSVSYNYLTVREKQILQLIVDGKTNKEIARELTLSNKTIETHRLNLMRKLNVHSSIELLKTALRMGACTI
ncbi:TPA: response regulator transcription factor [Escherichia fergusonii]|uniref:LuxR C-terminal-related transcriptional regulator n=1 Tax=Escherichia fergusonii TaxID=564 RepID=UPI0015F4E780|nr:response regulator transcription factor [Escherichia fergusonii]EHG5998749.1 response regulator transcription factor [Escherichia fergusonii]MBA8500745.1 response regulator transcription factor [Escherichia fergusonii]HAI1306453.1 response regulator transcription factor [Escherichia fergusonii]HCO8235814.1 response regulator transcription factor [Escherichia fergusonii]